RPEQLVITSLLGTNVADYLLTICVTTVLLRAACPTALAELYTTAICTPVVMVLGGIIPKDLFRRAADALMYPLSLPLTICHRLAVLSGAAWLLTGLSGKLIRRIESLKLGRDGEFARVVWRAR